MAVRTPCVWATMALVAIGGCSDAPPATPVSKNANAGSQSALRGNESGDTQLVASVLSVHEGAQVTEVEALAIGRAMEEAIAQGDIASFARQFDLDAFGELTFGALPRKTKLDTAFREGAWQGFQGAKPQVFPRIATVLSGGTYTLLRARSTDDGAQLVFRALSQDGGLNYHEVYLARRQGKARAVDIYIYLSGERLSETVFRHCLAATSAEQLRSMSEVEVRQTEILANVQALKDINEALRRGDSAQALHLYRGLPQHAQQSKLMLLMRVLAAQGLADDECVAAIDAYSTAFPDDPSLLLVSVDAFVVRKQYAEAHDALSRLSEAVGGDPYLLKLRASLYAQEGKLDEADRLMQLAIAADPRDLDAHWTWVGISLARKDHSRTAQLLTTIRDEFDEELADVREVPEYADFVKSAAFKEWIKTSPQPTP